ATSSCVVAPGISATTKSSTPSNAPTIKVVRPVVFRADARGVCKVLIFTVRLCGQPWQWLVLLVSFKTKRVALHGVGLLSLFPRIFLEKAFVASRSFSLSLSFSLSPLSLSLSPFFLL
ncbi:hypothetical protein QOT17_000218, partial [Balamuthia mandrillaris]